MCSEVAVFNTRVVMCRHPAHPARDARRPSRSFGIGNFPITLAQGCIGISTPDGVSCGAFDGLTSSPLRGNCQVGRCSSTAKTLQRPVRRARDLGVCQPAAPKPNTTRSNDCGRTADQQSASPRPDEPRTSIPRTAALYSHLAYPHRALAPFPEQNRLATPRRAQKSTCT